MNFHEDSGRNGDGKKSGQQIQSSFRPESPWKFLGPHLGNLVITHIFLARVVGVAERRLMAGRTFNPNSEIETTDGHRWGWN